MNEPISPGFLQSLINSIRDSIKIVDRDLNVVFANKIAEQRLGKSSSELIGKKCFREFYGNQQQCEFCITSRVFQTGEEERLEYQSVAESGEKHYFEMAVFPVRNDLGVINSVIEVTREVTERKQFENELVQSEKLASLGQVAASVAHEIRNPLTGIRLGLNALASSGSRNPRDKDIIESITHDIKRLDRVLNQLLDFARKKDPAKELMDISETINETAALIRHSADAAGVVMQIGLPNDLPALYVDNDQIKQVFMNLMLNAIQAMPSGGKLSISGRQSEHNGVQGIEISIADTGIGINPDEVDKIYDLFYSTKQDGTGVGLSISYKIIKEHGGTISVASKTGQGSTFTLFLPKQFQA